MPSQIFASVFGDSLFEDELGVHSNAGDIPVKTPFEVIEPLDEWLRRRWSTICIPSGYTTQDSIEGQSNNCHTAYVLLKKTITRFHSILQNLSQASDGLRAERVRSDAMSLFAYSLPLYQFVQVLRFVLYVVGSSVMGIHLDHSFNLDDVPLQADETELKRMLHELAFGLQEVGLGGDQTAQAHALAIDDLLDLLIRQRMWSKKEASYSRLETEAYITTHFTPFIHEMMWPMASLRDDAAQLDKDVHIGVGTVSKLKPEIQFWVDRGLEKMAKLMSRQLYDLIVSGRVENDDSLATDLEDIASTPAARGSMAVELHKQLAWNLLHPGSSTVSILDAYIQIIWALRRIDKTGVLLGRIAYDITAFLHTRDDAVRIVILSLLEAGENDEGQPKPSGENFSGRIAKLMNDAIKEDAVFGTVYYPGKDLNDPDWEPEPVDAFTGYRSARYRDTMGHMVTIKEKDVFIEELRSVLGDRLLKTDDLNPWKEVRLLEMFKARFEDFPIRECEIMVKDMQDSLYYFRYGNKKRVSLQDLHEFQVKVLSHTYWPALRDEKFNLPLPMQEQIDNYSRKFQTIKQYRQLDWVDAHGRVTVELELEDRTITEEVTTWQAAVIYQFDEDEMGRVSSAQPGTRSIADIEAATQMDEDLIRSALTFWVGKLVLLESVTYPDAYTVLERLSATSSASTNEEHLGALSSIAAAAAAAAQQAETEAAATELRTVADMFVENEALYTNFVVGMLTNQGHMPASRMMMMLKMLVAGGFPFEEVEFVEFLQGLADAGRIERVGGLWMVKK